MNFFYIPAACLAAILMGSCVSSHMISAYHTTSSLSESFGYYPEKQKLPEQITKPAPKRVMDAEKNPALALPMVGHFRFPVPKDIESLQSLSTGPNGGYIDRFGNEWVLTPIGKNVFWKQILSEDGKFRLSGLLSPEEKQRGYIFVRRFDGGKVALKS